MRSVSVQRTAKEKNLMITVEMRRDVDCVTFVFLFAVVVACALLYHVDERRFCWKTMRQVSVFVGAESCGQKAYLLVMLGSPMMRNDCRVCFCLWCLHRVHRL